MPAFRQTRLLFIHLFIGHLSWNYCNNLPCQDLCWKIISSYFSPPPVRQSFPRRLSPSIMPWTLCPSPSVWFFDDGITQTAVKSHARLARQHLANWFVAIHWSCHCCFWVGFRFSWHFWWWQRRLWLANLLLVSWFFLLAFCPPSCVRFPAQGFMGQNI